jgi:hypothetical protein
MPTPARVVPVPRRVTPTVQAPVAPMLPARETPTRQEQRVPTAPTATASTGRVPADRKNRVPTNPTMTPTTVAAALEPPATAARRRPTMPPTTSLPRHGGPPCCCSARPAPTAPPGNRRSTRPSLSAPALPPGVHKHMRSARRERGRQERVPTELAPPMATLLSARLQLAPKLHGLHDSASLLDHPLPGRQRAALPAPPARGAAGIQCREPHSPLSSTCGRNP